MDLRGIPTFVGAVAVLIVVVTMVLPQINQLSETISPQITKTSSTTVAQNLTTGMSTAVNSAENIHEWSKIASSEGVFIFNASLGGWIRMDLGASPWVPPDNATYLVYFKNLNCPACRAFDPVWDQYVEEYVKGGEGEPVTPVVVSCTWFTQQCGDPTALASFIAYQVQSTPTLVVWKNGSIVHYGQAQTAEEINELVG